MDTPSVDTHYTDDVFGMSRDVPRNYIQRAGVDSELITNLSIGRHIVIFGSSKQGKTCLRKYCLEPADYVVIQCSNDWDLVELHSAILKQIGFQIQTSKKITTSGANKIEASISSQLFSLWNAGVGVSTEEANGTEETYLTLELDPSDVNDVIQAIDETSFHKFIVLEDFHYLPEDTQLSFSVALKAFHEKSNISFIIVGVWLDENRLIVLNGDLAGRVISVNADEWSDNELRSVICEGGKLLNIDFHGQFVEQLLARSFDSVYVVQEVCRLCCEKENVSETQDTTRVIGSEHDVDSLVRTVIDRQGPRFRSFLRLFADGFQQTTLEMYRWLLFPVIMSPVEDLMNGLRSAEIRALIQDYHPRKSSLNPGSFAKALNSAASLQVKKGFKPIILDYDQTSQRLNVVDKGFLIWLKHQERRELLEEAGFSEAVIAATLSMNLASTPTRL